MKTIASFEVDHTKLKEGIYLSRIDRDVVTYDLRFVIPNNPENVYMENAAMHTVEHLFAVHARNGKYGGISYISVPWAAARVFIFLQADFLIPTQSS